MQSDRRRRSEMEYRQSLSAGVLVSIAAHLLLVSLGRFLIAPLHVRAEQPILLGYRGPQRPLLELELIEPNSIQAYFHQRQREGRRHAPEYRLLQKLEPDPGPEAMPVRADKRRPVEKAEPTVPDDDVVLREPSPPLHRQISFSECLVIHKAVEPEYPEFERARAVEGYALVSFFVTLQGKIQGAFVREAGASRAGESTRAFEMAALQAVEQWQPVWLCPRQDGEWCSYRFNFELRDLRR